METFLSYFKKHNLELYFNLFPNEKEILKKYGAQHLMKTTDKDSFSPKSQCQYLWTSAANIIPQGYYSLAKKLLEKAIELADNDLDKAHIYSNFAQIYADLNSIEDCIEHCDKTISTGYFIDWAENLKSEKLMQM